MHDKEPIKVLCQNKKARFDYHILDTYEAGIVLTGPEIKSVRNNGASIAEGNVRAFKDGMYLVGANIKPYGFSVSEKYDPIRPRKLLLNIEEIAKLRKKIEEKGLTIVPLRLYLKGGRAKLEVALAKGKDAPDKRDTIKKRESDRELRRVTKG